MAYKDKQEMYNKNNAYNKQTYDRIQVLPPKAEGAEIRAAAAAAGQSVSAYILEAVRERMKKENPEP